jgi:hypothetical protein
VARPEASEATGACLVRQRLTRWEHFSVRQYVFSSCLPLSTHAHFDKAVAQPPREDLACGALQVVEIVPVGVVPQLGKKIGVLAHDAGKLGYRGAEAAGIGDIGALHARDRVKGKPLDAVALQHRNRFCDERAHPRCRHVRRPVWFQIPRGRRLLEQLGTIVIGEARRRRRPAAVIRGNALAGGALFHKNSMRLT